MELKFPQLPFITREMLKFGHRSQLELRVTTQCDAAITIALSGMSREGTFSFNHITTNDSVIATDTFRIPDLPMAISLTDPAGVLEQGQCFARCALLIDGNVIHELVSGWVYTQKALSWPGGTNADLRPGGGRIMDEPIATPAAGNELTVTVPAGELWRVLGMSFILTTDANAADRLVSIVFTTAGSMITKQTAAGVQPASTALPHSVAAYASQDDVSGDGLAIINMPPEVWVNAGGTIESATVNIQVGDAYTANELLIERFFDPA